jgi:chromosome segregation ATPase
MEAAGGIVFRRARANVAEAQFDQDISAFKSEITELDAEVQHARGEAKAQLQAKATTAKAGLDRTVQRAKNRVEELKGEADTKVKSIKEQMAKANGEVKLEDRVEQVIMDTRHPFAV